MQVEHISRVSLASGRTAQDQGDFPVCDSLFREVIVDDKRITARIAEILPDGSSGKSGIVLQGGRVSGSGCDNDGVVHGSLAAESLDKRCYGACLLAYGNVDTIYRLPLEELRPLVDDRIDCDCGLPGLAVADDQLPLATPDGDHGINSLAQQAGGRLRRGPSSREAFPRSRP